ncbi:TonB-dependent receptor [Novosphingobium sp. BW1]|uniref:TonB-dependent receptor n=1 Tax=Novosphingobium sp. BW1 TaxID=2592621 RepID=UPI0011DE5B56|nr:TonB-dependent receptor [Novosphingobium sp. BW1]TYC89608.1 TonB-dependent receptor [Novosphingobium sp. BW1]
MGNLAKFLAASAICALAQPSVVQAQETGSGDAQDSDARMRAEPVLDAIVVTARRRSEDVQDVPLVVNTVTAEEFAELNIRDFTDVQQLVPGLQLGTSSNSFGANAQIRGVNMEVAASGFNNTIEFYQNDAPILPQVVLQQTFDIAQVEVLRGPQGALRGRASPSGSMIVTTHKPDLYEIGGYVASTANDIGTINVNGALGIPVIEGVAAVRVAGIFAEDEIDRVTTIYPTFEGRDPFARSKGGRITAVVQPTDWLRLEGGYQRLDRKRRNYDQAESFSQVSDLLGDSPVLVTAGDRNAIAEDARSSTETYEIFNWQGQASFAGQSLIYVGSRLDQDIASTESLDHGGFFRGFEYYQNTAGGAVATSHEIRLQNEEMVAGMFDYVVGAFFRTTDSNNRVFRDGPITLPAAFGGGIAALTQQDIFSASKTDEKSFFGNVTVHIGDATQISGGARYIKFKSTNEITLNAVNQLDPADRSLLASTPLGIGLNESDIDTDKLIYQVSAQHNFTPDVMLYASVGSSFRPGLFAVGDFSVNQSPLERSFQQTDDETSTSYELGLKTTLMGGRMRLNVAGYFQEFNNYPYRVPGASGIGGVYFVDYSFDQQSQTINPRVNRFNFVSGVPVEVWGMEGELSLEATPDLNISLVASYADGKIKDGVIPCNDFLNPDGVPDSPASAPSLGELMGVVGADNVSACTVNQAASNQPRFSATAMAEYSRPISNRVDAFVRGLYSFYGKSGGDPTNAWDSVKQYGLFNVFTGIRDPQGAWEVTLFAKNLFEMERVTERSLPLSSQYQTLPLQGFGPTGPIFGSPQNASFTSTYTNIRMTPPREFGINIRFTFGAR